MLNALPKEITTDLIKILPHVYVHVCVFIIARLTVFRLTQGNNAEEVLLKY